MTIIDLLSDNHEEQRKTRRVTGVAVGIVTSTKDPQGLGRVKVRFPWLSEAAESDWAKVMSFMAGKDRGGVFIPEVNDEVLVAFEHGDIDFPYVLGGLWNTDQQPPEQNLDGKNNVRKIRSRSGHEIVFNDNGVAGQECVEIRSSSGHSIILSDAPGKEHVLIKDKSGNNLIRMDSVGRSISMESGLKLSIKAQVVEIEAGAAMSLKAGATLSIQGGLVKIN
jgi:uncharacterized protein involved in type VI secretion and phage assembly